MKQAKRAAYCVSGRRCRLLFITLSVLAFALFAVNLLTGDSGITPLELARALQSPGDDGNIASAVLSIRVTRAVSALVAGAALSASGLLMQTVFRNPLADPYLLGVTSGASLGAALLMLGMPLLSSTAAGLLQPLGVAGAAWAGSALVLLGVAAASRWMKNILGILIVGVMFGYAAGAVIQVLQYMSTAENLKMFTLWSMGSMGNVTSQNAAAMASVTAVGLAMAALAVKPLNLLLLGEEYARSMGLDVYRSRALVFTSVTLLAGTTTAFCGPVGFIGLAVPHVARMLFANSDHRVMLPASVLVGIDVMLACDAIAKNLILPVNTVTALMGIPVIVWVVFKNLRLA